MRTPIIAGNWKMHTTVPEALKLVRELQQELYGFAGAQIIVAPPFTALAAVAAELKDSGIAVAAQNVFWEEKGAFTGEVAPGMLKDAGCTHAIIGHSERRQYFGETDQTVNRRVRAALAAGLVPIVCVGETLEQRESGAMMSVVERQVRGALAELSADDLNTVVIAYEPVWAIGTGKTATPGQAEEVHAFIRSLVAMIAGEATAGDLRILYGGSVKPDNVDELMRQEDIDGALVGGASLKAASFIRIARFEP